MTKNILDHTSDVVGTEHHQLTQLYSVPNFVKSANRDQVYGDTSKLPAHVYADQINKAFPCHTKAATWMSALFFENNKTELSEHKQNTIRTRIVKSANYFNIKNEVEQLWNKIAENNKPLIDSMEDSDFALVWDNGETRQRNYPLRNANEVKAAADWFNTYAHDFDFSDKNMIAQKILEKAASFNVSLPNTELLDKCAGYGYSPNNNIVQGWRQRSNLIRHTHTKHAEHATRIADMLEEKKLNFRDRNIKVKLATLLDKFDKDTGLDRLYGSEITRPEDLLFMLTEKTASEFANSTIHTTTGLIYEKSALDKVTIENIKVWLGTDIANEVGGDELDLEKLAEIVPTLPKPDATLFDKMLHNLGISATAKTKEASYPTVSTEELAELAGAYVASTDVSI